MKEQQKRALLTADRKLKEAMKEIENGLICAMQGTGNMHDVLALKEIADQVRRVEQAIDQLDLRIEFL